MVDEADDIFTGVDEDDRASRTGSKVFMNRLVERSEAPTIWITNSPERIGDAVVRRMTLALQFRAPNRVVRKRIAQRLAHNHLPSLSTDAIEQLAAVEAAPALIEAGLRAAALAGGGIDSVLRTTGSLIEAMGGLPQIAPRAETLDFDPSLSAADCDLTMLVECARKAYARGETALSFCLHGLSGTGKSAYARFIAKTLGIEVIEKRASDLMSMFVGGTEKRIARAFAEAADQADRHH